MCGGSDIALARVVNNKINTITITIYLNWCVVDIGPLALMLDLLEEAVKRKKPE